MSEILTLSRIVGPPWNPQLGGMPSFSLPLADAGSGAVNTTTLFSKGSGTPTFTRATTATTVNSAGLIVSVGSGVARSYYDPTTLAHMGYLAEGERTNLCLQSEDLSTSWTNTRSTETVNAAASPDGATTADKLVEDATAANTHFISQVITYTAVVYTMSVWLKAGERTWARIAMFDGTTTVSCFFNLSTGAVGTAANGSGSSKAYPNGWYRCTLTSTAAMAAAAGNTQIHIGEADNDITFNGDGASGIYVWGAQVEAGAFASSYIPTTTAAVTRNADVLSYPSAGNVTDATGTIYAEITEQNAASGVVKVGVSATQNTGMMLTTANTRIRSADGTNAADKTGLTDAATAVRKRAVSWGTGLSATGDGAGVGTAVFDGSMNIGAIGIGARSDGNAPGFGTLKNVRIWTTQLSDATLQGLTQ